MSGAQAVAVLIGVGIVWIVSSIPAFVVGRRCRVQNPGMAFVPVLGPYIVLLESIRRSGWLSLLGLVPLVTLFFHIWLVCVIPGEHGRSRWWILPFLIPGVNWIAFYVYAFTLPRWGERPVVPPRDPSEGLPGLRQYQHEPIRRGDRSDGPQPAANAEPAAPKDLFSAPSDA